MTQTIEQIQTNSFDYGNLPPEVVEAAEATAPRIHNRFKSVTRQQIENGFDLIETKARLGKALFRLWLDRYFEGSEYLARNLMKVASLVKRMPQLMEQMLEWTPSALAALSGASDKLAQELLAQSGDRPTAKAVKQRVRQERNPGKPEVKKKAAPRKADRHSDRGFSEEEVQEKIAAAIAEREKELESARIEQEKQIQQRAAEVYQQARDEALLAAQAEIAQAQEVRSQLVAKNARLTEQLQAKERELERVKDLQQENERLCDRVAQLESTLEQSVGESWQGTFNQQAAKVVNEELEQAYEPLVEKLEQMTQRVAQQEEELNRYRELSAAQEEQPVSEEAFALASDFGQLAETLELPGWSGRGYRASDGMLYKNLISAIAHFIRDFQPGGGENY